VRASWRLPYALGRMRIRYANVIEFDPSLEPADALEEYFLELINNGVPDHIVEALRIHGRVIHTYLSDLGMATASYEVVRD